MTKKSCQLFKIRKLENEKSYHFLPAKELCPAKILKWTGLIKEERSGK